VLTGKKKDLPAESELTYKLATDAQMTPYAARQPNQSGSSNPQK